MSASRRSGGRAVRTLALATSGLLLGGCTVDAERVSGRGPCPPDCNVILISIDTLRADHLGLHGYARDTSPNLDRLARESVVFENAISQSAWTTPAHASMFTGLLPSEHGLVMYDNPGVLSDDVVTLAETLRERGFHTVSWNGGGFVSPAFGLDDGFDVYRGAGRDFGPNIRQALGWLGRHGDERFFLFLHGFDVHRHYVTPEAFDLFSSGEVDYPIERFCSVGHKERPSDPVLEYVISQYDAGIRYTDALLGGFLDALRASGLLDRSIVVVTSDHGDEFFEHGRCDHVRSVYEELVHVPLLARVPGVEPRRVAQQVPASVGVAPTLLELLELDAPEAIAGRSLAPLVRGAPLRFPMVVSLSGHTGMGRVWQSLRTEREKLILIRDEGGEHHELYELAEDPDERRDLAAARPDAVRRILAAAQQGTRTGRRRTRPAHIDPETAASLRALGYLE